METKEVKTYYIHPGCPGCAACFMSCPVRCIKVEYGSLVIDQEKCIHCGICMRVCEFAAIEVKE